MLLQLVLSSLFYTDDASLLSCPQTFLQAMADRGRFMFDEYCNPEAKDLCFFYHEGVMHCFRTNIPRSSQENDFLCCGLADSYP